MTTSKQSANKASLKKKAESKGLSSSAPRSKASLNTRSSAKQAGAKLSSGKKPSASSKATVEKAATPSGRARRPSVATNSKSASESRAKGRESSKRRASAQSGKRTAEKRQRSFFARAYDAFCAIATLLGHASKRALVMGGIALVLAVGLIGAFATSEARVEVDLNGLPSYITEDMVLEARSMQARYGHPAGCTIAQIIQESGSGDRLSQLAEEDHNLFGMKWASSFADCDGVVGPANWDTNEEYDGQYVQINDAFVEFESDSACIRFRSAVFLQASTYADNSLIQQAIARCDSKLMAQGLQDAGWATDSNYANALIALMDEYDLYRFDS